VHRRVSNNRNISADFAAWKSYKNTIKWIEKQTASGKSPFKAGGLQGITKKGFSGTYGKGTKG